MQLESPGKSSLFLSRNNTCIGKVQWQTHRFSFLSYQKPAHLSIYPAILFQKVKNTPKRFAPTPTNQRRRPARSLRLFRLPASHPNSLAEFRQDAGINCNLFFPAACTSEKILLRRVSVRAQRVHAPGCNLRQNACILSKAQIPNSSSHHTTWSVMRDLGTSMTRWFRLPRKRRVMSFSFKMNGPSTSTFR